MSTYTEILQRITDASAKSEASYSLSDILSYSDYSQIKDEESIDGRISSYEHNLFVLDGKQWLIPTDYTTMRWGIWSNSVSNINGDFISNPILTVNLSTIHTTTGITISFGGDSYAKQVIVKWYNNTTLLETKTDTVNNTVYFVDLTVENYNKVVIEFIGTNIPYRHIKINEIDFGQIFIWTKDTIISANILEEINLTSSEITINTLDFSIAFTMSAEGNLLICMTPLRSGMQLHLKAKQS